MMKRFLSFCTAAALILGLTACAAPEEETYKAALTSPPELTVVSGDQEVTALLGGYTWDYCIGDDQWRGVCVDCAHPLQCQDLMTPLTTTEGSVRLEFAEEPLEFTVRCWSDSCWGDDYLGELDAVEEPVTVDGYTVTLKPEGYIYQVIAKWDTAEPAAKGTAYYSFYAVDTVFRSWCRMVGSQLLLLVMNVWFLRGFASSMGQFIANGGALSTGKGSIFLWMFCALAYLKCAQRFDSYLASIGLNVAQTGSSTRVCCIPGYRRYGTGSDPAAES